MHEKTSKIPPMMKSNGKRWNETQQTARLADRLSEFKPVSSYPYNKWATHFVMCSWFMEALDGFRLRPPPAFFTRCATIAAELPFSLSRGFCQEGEREGRLHGGRIRALIRIEIQGTFCNGAPIPIHTGFLGPDIMSDLKTNLKSNFKQVFSITWDLKYHFYNK